MPPRAEGAGPFSRVMPARHGEERASAHLRAVWIGLVLGLLLVMVYEYIPLTDAFFSPQDFRTIFVPRAAGWSTASYFSEGWSFTELDGTRGGFFRPLPSLMYIPEYELFGLDPAPWAVADFVVHLAACLVLWRAARSLGLGRIGSFAAAVVLAIHPRATPAVWMVNTRPDVLATLFLVAGCAAAVKARHSTLAAMMAALLSLAAIASKELGYVSVLLLPLFHLGWPGERPRPRRTILLLLLLSAVAAAGVLCRSLVLDYIGGYRAYLAPSAYPEGLADLLLALAGTSPAGTVVAVLSLAAMSLAAAAASRGRSTGRRVIVIALSLPLLGSQAILSPGSVHYWYAPCAALALLLGCILDGILSARRTTEAVSAAFILFLAAPFAVLGKRINLIYARSTSEQAELFKAVAMALPAFEAAGSWAVILTEGGEEKPIRFYLHCLQRSERTAVVLLSPGEIPDEASGIVTWTGDSLRLVPPVGSPR
jgi:hypothetical protein